ncbi:MAG: T9SS type A sorting domain-containing protein, partial [Candidatus Latescibacterota bacterium]
QSFFNSAFEILDITPDRYDVRRPTALMGNGPGRRVVDVILQLAIVYQTIIWNTGDLREGLISDGEKSLDLSDDFGMLFTFLDQSPNQPGLYITGDNIAEEWVTLSGPAATDVRATYINFDLVNGDHKAAGEPTSPLVIGQPGSCFDGPHGPDSLVAFGGCPGKNSFDVLAATSASQLAMTYSNNPAHGAVLTQVTPNSVGDTARVAFSGFSYHEIRDDRVQSPVDRVQHLFRILKWIDSGIADPTVVPDPPHLRNELAQNYPNPFNPSTTIRYSIKERGRVTLRIYSVAGKLVRTLVDDIQSPLAEGFLVMWDGTSTSGNATASGVYFYRLTAKNFTKTKKMIILK